MQAQTHSLPGFPHQVCDFCNQGSFVKAYACHSFVYLKGTPMEHYRCEEWAACGECAALIDAEQWGTLTDRAVRAFVRQHQAIDYDVPALREHVSDLHRAFRQYLIRES
jgi:hypothetical protein